MTCTVGFVVSVSVLPGKTIILQILITYSLNDHSQKCDPAQYSRGVMSSWTYKTYCTYWNWYLEMMNTLNACKSFSVETYRRRHWLANKLPEKQTNKKQQQMISSTKNMNWARIKIITVNYEHWRDKGTLYTKGNQLLFTNNISIWLTSNIIKHCKYYSK